MRCFRDGGVVPKRSTLHEFSAQCREWPFFSMVA
jgi:hypothetical protein